MCITDASKFGNHQSTVTGVCAPHSLIEYYNYIYIFIYSSMTVYNAACIDGASESRIWAGDETWKNHGETTGSLLQYMVYDTYITHNWTTKNWFRNYKLCRGMWMYYGAFCGCDPIFWRWIRPWQVVTGGWAWDLRQYLLRKYFRNVHIRSLD